MHLQWVKRMLNNNNIDNIRSDLPFIANGIYVDNASVSPISREVQSACDHFNTIIAEQLRDAKELTKVHYDNGRVLAAKLIGSSARNITYIQNTSHGLSLVALGIDWKDGDNIIVSSNEFPSNYLCWLQLKEKGVEIRLISSDDGTLEPELVRSAINDRTRLVAISHVQFYSGYRVDLANIATICSKHKALLVVDGTQSVGAIALDVGLMGIDVLAVSAHKWMMGPRGIGFASISDGALNQIKPSIVGWLSVNEPFAFNRTLDYLPDARRFEAGTPNGSGIFGLEKRLEQIHRFGIEHIEDRVLHLSQLVTELALKNGINPVYLYERERSSGIVLLRTSHMNASEMNERLSSEKIFASVRNGAIRIAAHYYNTADEIEHIVSVMKE